MSNIVYVKKKQIEFEIYFTYSKSCHKKLNTKQVIILQLKLEGAAYKSQQLKVGNRILEVDNKSLLGELSRTIINVMLV